MKNMYGYIGVTVSAAVLLAANAWSQNLYHLSGVDYFNQRNDDTKDKDITIDWKEGGAQPPDKLIDLLNNPTSENVKAYIQWLHFRQERLTLVNQLIAKELSSKAPDHD